MCLDSVQFADPPLAGLCEFRRVLAAGGRLVLTRLGSGTSSPCHRADRLGEW